MESDSIVKTNLLVTGTSVQNWVTVHSVTSNYFPAAQSPPITFILLKKQEIFQIEFRLIYRSIPTFYFKSARHSYKVLA